MVIIFLWCKHQWNSRLAFARKHDIFTRENNMLLHNLSQMCCGMIKTSSVSSRKSSVIFGNIRNSPENVREMFRNFRIRLTFRTITKISKSSEIDRKTSEKHQKHSYSIVCNMFNSISQHDLSTRSLNSISHLLAALTRVDLNSRR